MENTKLEVPLGDNREDIKAREKIISDVYRKWYEENPSKAVYNANLQDNINVRFLSITETMRHAAKTYLSTLAVLQLDVILKCATKVGEPTPIKPGVNPSDGFRLQKYVLFFISQRFYVFFYFTSSKMVSGAISIAVKAHRTALLSLTLAQRRE